MECFGGGVGGEEKSDDEEADRLLGDEKGGILE